jgi:hypothetical protein
MTEISLQKIKLPLKALFTGYLMVIGLGLLMAGVQIMLTHGMADGKLGLSVDDIVYSYYGNRSGSKLESKLNGAMKDKAPPEVRMDIIKWVRNGAPQTEWEAHFKEVFAQHCTMCHSAIPGLPDFTHYPVVKQEAMIDEGANIASLTRESHIHLFGVAFIFFFVGWIFSYATGFSNRLKAFLIFTPFAFLILDVASWWLTKWNPNFAWLVIIGGFGYSLASTVMILTSLYQMWLMKRPASG